MDLVEQWLIAEKHAAPERVTEELTGELSHKIFAPLAEEIVAKSVNPSELPAID